METFVEKAGVSSFVIHRSKFFSYCNPFQLLYFPEQIDHIRKEHPSATHIVYAYRVKSESGSLFEKFSDAGEPSGTAGKPTLRLLQMKNIINSALYTVRYFGGIKLGKGGLVRAYTDSAKLALENAIINEYVVYRKIKFSVSYPLFELIEREMHLRRIPFLEKEFAEYVNCVIQCRIEKIKEVKTYFSELGIESYAIID